MPPDVPRPVDWAFIKTDVDSQNKARDAFVLFDEILQRHSSDDPFQEALELWRLASLAVNQSEQSNAEQYAKHLLKRRPCSYLVVEWIVQRDWPIEVSTAVADIEKQLQDGAADWFAAVVVSNQYISRGQTDAAIRLLNLYQDRFAAPMSKTAWALSMAAAYSRNGDYAAALATLGQAPGDVTVARFSIEAAKARSTKRYDEVLETIRSVDLNNPFWLLMACEIWADAGKWGDVFERREQLLSSLANEYS